MITITKIKTCTLEYCCTCGIVGECMFKPPKGNAVMVLEIACPMCHAVEHVKLLKYDSEKSKKILNTENTELRWTIIMDNKIKKEE